MTGPAASGKLDSAQTLDQHLDALVALDPRLEAVRQKAGAVLVRAHPSGFAGLAQVICGQQLSVASAHAIWERLRRLEGALEPETFLLIDEDAGRGAGLSGGKYRTLRTLAEAIGAGELDFEMAHTLPANEAIAHLTRHKGVGPWTAEIYLMFCAGHPDVFPAGDLALQKAVGQALGLGERVAPKALSGIASGWAPFRSAAALLFWRYFAALSEKQGIAL